MSAGAGVFLELAAAAVAQVEREAEVLRRGVGGGLHLDDEVKTSPAGRVGKTARAIQLAGETVADGLAAPEGAVASRKPVGPHAGKFRVDAWGAGRVQSRVAAEQTQVWTGILCPHPAENLQKKCAGTHGWSKAVGARCAPPIDNKP